MSFFGTFREVFATEFNALVAEAFDKENERRKREGKDPLRSLDAFLGEVGGDSAKKAYYRVRRFISDNPQSPIRHGAFNGLVRAVGNGRLIDEELDAIILEFDLLRFVHANEAATRYTDDYIRSSFNRLYGDCALKDFRSVEGFQEVFLSNVNYSLQNNDYDCAYETVNILLGALRLNLEQLNFVSSDKRKTFESILYFYGQRIAIDENDPILHAV